MRKNTNDDATNAARVDRILREKSPATISGMDSSQGRMETIPSRSSQKLINVEEAEKRGSPQDEIKA